jgi:hypothetical protein
MRLPPLAHPIQRNRRTTSLMTQPQLHRLLGNRQLPISSDHFLAFLSVLTTFMSVLI